MTTDEMDWLYWNRDRVSETDWWLWVDDLSDQEIVRVGEFWLDHLARSNRAGHAVHLVASITHDWHQGLGMTPRQRRALAAAVREHWADLRAGSIS